MAKIEDLLNKENILKVQMLLTTKKVEESQEKGHTYEPSIMESIERFNEHMLSEENLSVSMKFYASSVRCLSELTEFEIKKFSKFCEDIRDYTSPESLKRTEYACTTSINYDSYSKYCVAQLSCLGYKIDYKEVHHYKLSEEARIHGVWKNSRFKLMWIDPGHELHRKNT